MVTKNRAQLARRALQCLADQTWPRLELIVVDDGNQDYEPLLSEYRSRFPILYHRLAPDAGRTLGELRNMAQDLARGRVCAQWDDDEWCHPRRIEAQMDALERAGAGAAVLCSTLVHINAPGLAGHLFRAHRPRGTPGTIVYLKTSARYPAWRRHEDTLFLARLAARAPIAFVDDPDGHLFIRCHHGGNTWAQRHFLSRLYRSPGDAWEYVCARFIDRDLRAHRAFRLSPREAAAAARFERESRELGLWSASV